MRDIGTYNITDADGTTVATYVATSAHEALADYLTETGEFPTASDALRDRAATCRVPSRLQYAFIGDPEAPAYTATRGTM